VAKTREATQSREWSSIMLRISTPWPSARAQWGHVGLPALVGELGGETFVGALRSFLWLRGDEAAGFEGPPDGGDGGDVGAAACEVGVDGGGSGVDAEVAQLFVEGDDVVLVCRSDGGRRVVRSFRARLEAGVAFCVVAGEEFVEPAAVDAVGGGQFCEWTPGP
jgi:hypothetical protein